jgi:hypothetical protein
MRVIRIPPVIFEDTFCFPSVVRGAFRAPSLPGTRLLPLLTQEGY